MIRIQNRYKIRIHNSKILMRIWIQEANRDPQHCQILYECFESFSCFFFCEGKPGSRDLDPSAVPKTLDPDPRIRRVSWIIANLVIFCAEKEACVSSRR